jgi:hypothetical protein
MRENAKISALTSFHTLQELQRIRKVSREGAAKVLQAKTRLSAHVVRLPATESVI